MDKIDKMKKLFITPVHFKSIEEIRKYRFYGNHTCDHQAFRGIQRFAEDESNSLSDRAEAIRIKCDRGMGMPVSEEFIKETIDIKRSWE